MTEQFTDYMGGTNDEIRLIYVKLCILNKNFLWIKIFALGLKIRYFYRNFVSGSFIIRSIHVEITHFWYF